MTLAHRGHVWKQVDPTWVISLPSRPLTAASRPTRHAVLAHGLMDEPDSSTQTNQSARSPA